MAWVTNGQHDLPGGSALFDQAVRLSRLLQRQHRLRGWAQLPLLDQVLFGESGPFDRARRILVARVAAVSTRRPASGT